MLATAGHWRRICSPSWGVSVGVDPMPKLTPPLAAAPDCTMIELAPMLPMVASKAAFEPCPISIMAITAPRR